MAYVCLVFLLSAAYLVGRSSTSFGDNAAGLEQDDFVCFPLVLDRVFLNGAVIGGGAERPDAFVITLFRRHLHK